MPASRGFAVGYCFHLVGSFHFCFELYMATVVARGNSFGPVLTGRVFTPFQKEKATGIAKNPSLKKKNSLEQVNQERTA